MSKNPDLAAAIMSNQAVLLQAVGHALSLDLAIAPLVLATEPGLGTITAMRAIAEGLGMAFVDVRCGNIGYGEFSQLERVTTGDVIAAAQRLSFDDALRSGKRVLLLLDEALSNDRTIAESIMAQVSKFSSTPVLMVLTVRLDQEDEAIDSITHVLGIHRALVPSARLAVSETLKQPVLLVGAMIPEGSKRGERYFDLQVYEPFESRVNFTLQAYGDQGDDELNAFLDALTTDSVAVRLEPTDGFLTCTTADITAI